MGSSSWMSSNVFVSGVGRQRFKSQARQIELSAANGSPLLQNFFKRSCAAGRNDMEIGIANSLHALV